MTEPIEPGRSQHAPPAARDAPPELPVLIQMASFGLIGVANTLVDVGAFWLLVSQGLHPYIANVLSFSLGAANSLLLNSLVTFRGRTTAPPLRLAGKFAAVTLLALAVSQLTLVLSLNAGLTELAGKLVSVGFTFVVSFSLNRNFAFREVVK